MRCCGGQRSREQLGMANAPDSPTPKPNILGVRGLWPTLGCCAALMLTACLVLPAIQAAREAARRATCTNNLKMIGVGVHNYHDSWHCFPGPFIPDAKGKPVHSWRVSTWPYLEARRVIDLYDYRFPWEDRK